MLMFALSAQRAQSFHPEIARLVLAGDIATAFSLGNARLDRAAESAMSRAILGQLLGRMMLASGREEDAQETFERIKRFYSEVSRSYVKSHSALDQGALYLHMNRPGRAAECFSEVADDTAADSGCRVDGLVGLAGSMMCLGELRTARRAMDAARDISSRLEDGSLSGLVDCISLDLEASAATRCNEALSDHALWRQSGEDSPRDAALLVRQIDQALLTHGDSPLIAVRLRMLRDALPDPKQGAARQFNTEETLNFLQRARLSGFDASIRIEMALALLAQGVSHAASQVLVALVRDDQSVRRSRYSLELEYCLSKLYQAQGRPTEALRAYKLHTEDALQAIRKELTRVPQLRTAPQESTVHAEADTAQLRLPLRYRKAYQYIMDRLSDPSLSVRDVAEHIPVTERALQIAFRTYLGETPAEFIRRRRMEGIRRDLRDNAGAAVLDIATNWGVHNRSTLAQAYRRNYQETPSQTRRGAAAA